MRGPQRRDRRPTTSLVGHVLTAAATGSICGLPAALRLPDVPDPGDVALVQQRVAERARRGRRRAAASETARSRTRSPARRGRARPGADRSARGPSVISSSSGPSNCDDLVHRRRGARATPAAASAASGAGRVHAPDPGHPQVRVEHQLALEVQEQVLAVRLDARDRAAGEALGPAVRANGAAAGCSDLVRHAALQHRADPVRAPRDRVALRHRR